VFTHTVLKEVAPDFVRALKARLGPVHLEVWADHPREDGIEGRLMWMRDFSPFFVADPLHQTGWRAIMTAPENEKRANFWERGLPRKNLQAMTVSPFNLKYDVRHENGNLVSTGEWVILSEDFLEANACDPDWVSAEATCLSSKNLQRQLATILGLPTDRVIFVPPMPGEGTKHADVFVMALAHDTVLVPEIPREHPLLKWFFEHPLWIAKEVAEHLDQVAFTLEENGLTVLRAPMLPPMPDVELDDEDELDWAFFTPANAFLDRGADWAAFLPIYSADPILDPELQEVQIDFELVWKKILLDEGYDVIPVTAHELSHQLGVFRCVTATAPEWFSAIR
jgi:hypothetical protein